MSVGAGGMHGRCIQMHGIAEYSHVYRCCYCPLQQGVRWGHGKGCQGRVPETEHEVVLLVKEAGDEDAPEDIESESARDANDEREVCAEPGIKTPREHPQ